MTDVDAIYENASSRILLFTIVSHAHSAVNSFDQHHKGLMFFFSQKKSSNFRVGAAILTIEDEVITGCNVENAAFSKSFLC
jgi:hypothetical protein